MEEPQTPSTPSPSPPRAGEPATSAPRGADRVIPDKAVSELTPEEQMARFAQALKEEDWGHQPC